MALGSRRISSRIESGIRSLRRRSLGGGSFSSRLGRLGLGLKLDKIFPPLMASPDLAPRPVRLEHQALQPDGGHHLAVLGRLEAAPVDANVQAQIFGQLAHLGDGAREAVHHAAAGQALKPRAKGVLEQADKVGVGSPRVEKQWELGGQGGREVELGCEGVELDFFGAVVQAVVVEAELAEGDEFWGGGGAGFRDEGGQVGYDVLAASVIDAVAVEDGLGRVRSAGRGVFGLAFAFALALVMVFVVGGAEDGAAAGVDACGCKDGAGYSVVMGCQSRAEGMGWAWGKGETDGIPWRV